MNVRNLVLISMVFCAAPIVCVVPEVNLTMQDQEKVIGWTRIVKSLSPQVQEFIKAVITLHKDITEFHLGSLHTNALCVPEYKKNLFERMNVLLEYIRRDTNSNNVMQ